MILQSLEERRKACICKTVFAPSNLAADYFLNQLMEELYNGCRNSLRTFLCREQSVEQPWGLGVQLCLLCLAWMLRGVSCNWHRLEIDAGLGGHLVLELSRFLLFSGPWQFRKSLFSFLHLLFFFYWLEINGNFPSLLT